MIIAKRLLGCAWEHRYLLSRADHAQTRIYNQRGCGARPAMRKPGRLWPPGVQVSARALSGANDMARGDLAMVFVAAVIASRQSHRHCKMRMGLPRMSHP